MKTWKDISFDECPECGSSLEGETDAKEEGWFFDGDPVRCTECKYTSSISVNDDEGNAWVQ